MIKRLKAIILAVLATLALAQGASAFSLNLDSIAALGKFPKFCIDTYRWGDKFFNGYDTVYVNPTGYRFNIKLKTDSWLASNTFRFDDNRYQMNMRTYPSTSMGVWLTYMAVSAGYDVNVSNLLGLSDSSRKRFNFQFNCMLFAADLFLEKNDSRMEIKRFGQIGDMQKVDIPFDNLSSSNWGLDLYYFFNHKHYSQSAAFFYSRIQNRSSGSFYAGLSFSGQNYKFDFSSLPSQIVEELPDSWPHYKYHIHAHNYAFKLGYGYNIVLSKRCVIGLTDGPSIGVRYGYINNPADKHTTLYAFNRAKVSFIYNNDHWFAGVVGQADTNLFSNRDHSLITNNLSLEASVGYRFNLW